MKIAIPCHIAQITLEEEERLQELFRRFGNARRRAYNLRRKSYSKSDIEKQLQAEHDINSRYAKDAYHSIKGPAPTLDFWRSQEPEAQGERQDFQRGIQCEEELIHLLPWR